MDDSSNEILRCHPGRLRRLLELRLEPPWREGDYGRILADELATPLSCELESPPESVPESDRSWLDKTFAEVLEAPEAPLSILQIIKDFAKEDRLSDEGHLPREVATLLYYAAVADALRFHGKRITSLESAEIGKGIDWALSRKWLSESMRSLFIASRRCQDGSKPKP